METKYVLVFLLHADGTQYSHPEYFNIQSIDLNEIRATDKRLQKIKKKAEKTVFKKERNSKKKLSKKGSSSGSETDEGYQLSDEQLSTEEAAPCELSLLVRVCECV